MLHHAAGTGQQGAAEANGRYALLRTLNSEIIWEMNEAVLLRAAKFKAHYRLSFADAVIAAYVALRDAVLLHKDPEYEVLEDVQQEVLPYK